MTKILIIDDDKKLVRLLEKYLLNEGYQVDSAFNGPSGVQAVSSIQPEIIILDVMLPGFDGNELLRQLRPVSNAYVIMLTAKSEELDKVLSLTMGADDYMVKPFSPKELIARIKAAMRRLESSNRIDKTIKIADIEINSESFEIRVKGSLLELTKTEFALAEILVKNVGRVLTREQLIQHIWGHDFFGESRVIDVHIGSLRKKLGEGKYIKTIRGIGYKFEPGKS